MLILFVIAYNMYAKCDTYNVGIARYAKDGTMDVTYVRVCRDSLDDLNDIIESTNKALKNR